MKTKVALAFLILTLTACGIAPTPTSTPTPPPSTATFTFTPEPPKITETATLSTPQEPPACTFPLPQTTMEESMPEEYTFSEPRVVKTNRYSIDIVEWLPDSRRALITEVFAGDNIYKENIELFNPETGEAQIYAVRENDMWHRPAWIQDLNAVLYPTSKTLNRIDGSGSLPSYEIRRQLIVSRGNTENVQIIVDEQLIVDKLTSFMSVVKPDGSAFIFHEGTENLLVQYNVVQGVLRDRHFIPFDSTRWENKNEKGVFAPVYEMAWRPNTTQLFLRSRNYGIPHGDYSLLFDVKNRSVCAIDFGSEMRQKKWAIMARWSSNGRYLAIVGTRGPQPSSSDLTVLDTTTGKIFTMKFAPQDMAGMNYITDIAWAPDNYHLAAISETISFPHCAPNCYSYRRLYLADFMSNTADILFPSYQVGGGQSGTGLAWSSDGSKILVACPTEKEGRLCFIPVQVSGQ